MSRWVIVLQKRLDGFVLLVELSEIGNKVLDDVHWEAQRSERSTVLRGTAAVDSLCGNG